MVSNKSASGNNNLSDFFIDRSLTSYSPSRTTLVGPDANDLTYMLVWESLADREQKWNAFMADSDWQEAKAASEKDGIINAKVANSFLTPTKFSAIQ